MYPYGVANTSCCYHCETHVNAGCFLHQVMACVLVLFCVYSPAPMPALTESVKVHIAIVHSLQHFMPTASSSTNKCVNGQSIAVPLPPRPVQTETWKIAVSVVGGLLSVFLIATLVYMWWKHWRPKKHLKVSLLSCSLQHVTIKSACIVVSSWPGSLVSLKSTASFCRVTTIICLHV